MSVPPWATHVLSDHTGMHRDPQAVDASAVRRFRLALPDDVYFEYAFLDGEGRVRADPERPERGENPWYPEVTAVRGPDYRPHPLAAVPEARARGHVRRLRVRSEVLGEQRRVTVYRPEDATGPLPLLLVQDGTAYHRLARLPAVLEALRAEGRARPALVAFVDPTPGEAAREAEYGFGDAFRRFVWEEALPHVRAREETTEETLLLGASLGGLASLLLALDRPEAIAGLATQSGAFLGAPDERDFFGSTRRWVAEALCARDAWPWRTYLEVGTLEWLLSANREVSRVLAERAVAHRYEERSAGHNWTNWRNGLPEALAFLLAPGRVATPR